MTSPVIRIQDISKLYRLGETGFGSLVSDFSRWRDVKLGRKDPWMEHARENIRSQKIEAEFVWALKDINLDIYEGEIVGIIGKNGAGKSTLLKLISRITAPTTGVIKIRGRIASLLEVGTGMHPDMTARENIYMNGAILGMKKNEITRRFDEIIDFAGCALYVDTPIKRFSSGMRVRLGFSVAAFLDPEILIVDEVLAVGDAEFQKRALGKMREITGSQGRTLLFVSHNLASVRYICEKGVLLKDGVIKSLSDINSVLDEYKAGISKEENTIVNREMLEGSSIKGFRITDLEIRGQRNDKRIISGEDIYFIIKYKCNIKYSSPAFVVIIKDEYENEIIRLSNMPISGYKIDDLFDNGSIELKINRLPLVKGNYLVDIGFVHEKVEWHFRLENIVELYVEGNDIYGSGLELDRNRGVIWVDHNWIHSPEKSNVVN